MRHVARAALLVVALGSAPGLLAVSRPLARPVRLAAGSWATNEAPAKGQPRARLQLHSGPASELAARLEAELALAVVSIDGSPATPRSLSEGAPETGRFLLWVSAPLEGARTLEASLRAQPMRHQLQVTLSHEAADAGAPARRWFGLWHLPADLPLLTARVAVAGPDGRVDRTRFVGPLGAHPRPGGGWGDPTEHILRAPVREIPRSLQEIVGPGPPPPGQAVPWQIVAHGDHSGAVRKAGRRVLRDERGVRREWERLHQGQLAVGPPPRLPPGGEVLIALYQGTLDEARARREVVGVWESDAGLVVGVRAQGDQAEAGESPYVWLRVRCAAGTRVQVRPM